MGPIAFAVSAALTYGTSDFLGGLASRRMPVVRVVLWSQIVGLAAIAVVAPILGGVPTASELGLGAVAGLAGAGGLLSLYRGLSTGESGVVAPVSGVVAAVLPALVAIAAGERPDGVTLVGFLLAFAAVWLVSGGRLRAGSGVVLGLAAGVGFGSFAIAMGPVAVSAGLWPLVPARVASIGLLLVVSGRLRSTVPSAGSRRLLVAVGLGDMGANAMILLALQHGPLGEGAVLSSLYPVATVVLSAIVLKERVRAGQWAGIGLAVAAMALIAS